MALNIFPVFMPTDFFEYTNSVSVAYFFERDDKMAAGIINISDANSIESHAPVDIYLAAIFDVPKIPKPSIDVNDTIKICLFRIFVFIHPPKRHKKMLL